MTAGPELEPLVRAAASSMLAGSEAFAAELADRIATEIPELATDPVLVNALTLSVLDGLRAATTHFASGEQTFGDAVPASAIEFARRLAERGIPATVLLRGYRVGQALGQERMMEALAHVGADPALVVAATQASTNLSFAYVDRISEQAVAVHERARLRWQEGKTQIRLDLVAALLGGNLDAARGLLEELTDPRKIMVASIAWTDRGTLPEVVVPSSGSLVVPVDRATVWIWAPREGAVNGAPFGLATGEAWVACGEPGAGAEGAVRSHVQAREVQLLTNALERGSRPQVAHMGDLRLPLLLARDRPAAREWIEVTLGQLARNDDKHARLRATLAVFLAAGGSFSAAAARLSVHRNTVLYRVRRAEEALGRPVEENRLEIEAALFAAEWIHA